MADGSQLIIDTITKGGIGAVIVGSFYGLSLLITAWRGGTRSAEKEADLEKQVQLLRQEMDAMKVELANLKEENHDMRFQRDDARLRVRFLELKHGEPLTDWEAADEEYRAKRRPLPLATPQGAT